MKIFSAFDLFSQQPFLRVNGKKRPTTIFGSIIGLFTIIFLIIGIIYQCYNYFSGKLYTVSSYSDNSLRPELDLTNFKTSFLVTDLYGNQLPERHRLFQISAKFWDIFIPNNGAMDLTQQVTSDNIPKIKCTDYKSNLFNNEIFLYSQRYDFDCFDFTAINKNLTGIYNSFGG